MFHLPHRLYSISFTEAEMCKAPRIPIFLIGVYIFLKSPFIFHSSDILNHVFNFFFCASSPKGNTCTLSQSFTQSVQGLNELGGNQTNTFSVAHVSVTVSAISVCAENQFASNCSGVIYVIVKTPPGFRIWNTSFKVLATVGNEFPSGSCSNDAIPITFTCMY